MRLMICGAILVLAASLGAEGEQIGGLARHSTDRGRSGDDVRAVYLRNQLRQLRFERAWLNDELRHVSDDEAWNVKQAEIELFDKQLLAKAVGKIRDLHQRRADQVREIQRLLEADILHLQQRLDRLTKRGGLTSEHDPVVAK